MGEALIQKILKDSFPLSDIESWKKIAAFELDGSEPFTKLAWPDRDGIQYFPYYTREHRNTIPYLKKFYQRPNGNSLYGNRAWLNLPCINVTDELSDNKTALTHLMNGADGILFTLSQNITPDLPKLLQGVELPYCSISFSGQLHQQFIFSLEKFLTGSHIDPSSIAGNLFWETIPQKGDHLHPFKNLKSSGCLIKASTPVKEICDALLQGVEMMNIASTECSIQNISFSIPLDTDFLSNISKIKALRLLWYQVAMTYGVENYLPDDVHVHARSDVWFNEKYEPHGNMVKSTTAAMSAMIGGCDSLTVYAANEQSEMMNRVARNVSNILREESKFDKVADPLAGAYAIEVMTDALAKKAWSEFQLSLAR